MSDTPPPRPPKPSRLSPALPVMTQGKLLMPPSTPHSEDKDDGYHIMSACPDVEPESEPIPLEKLARESYADFPINVVVADSLYGVCEDRTLMEGEPLTLHFLKRTKVGVLESSNGMEYMVPWNSTFQFSPIYDPINQPLESLKGFSFHSAVDLMALERMPQLVKVTSDYDGGRPNHSVHAGEVLAKLETVYDAKSKLKWLKCISIESGHEKQLSSNCTGKFTTNPSFLKYYLSEIANYLQLPAKLMFQPSRFPQYKLPSQFINSFFTLRKHCLHQTVIASGHISTGSYGTLRQRRMQVQRLIELSLEADIDVQLIETPVRERESMEEYSKHIYSTFEPSLVERMVINTSPVTNQIQLELYRAVRLDYWKEGIEVVQPGVKHAPRPAPRPTKSTQNEVYDYPWIAFPGSKKGKNRGKKSKPSPNAKLALPPHSPPVVTPPLRSPIAHNEDEDDYLPMDESFRRIEDYENPQHAHDVWNVTSKPTNTAVASNLPIERKTLEDYSCDEVLVLLDALGLSAYKPVFAGESIDGRLLLECDDPLLENELHMDKPLHRLKLMRVISGKQSLNDVWKRRE